MSYSKKMSSEEYEKRYLARKDLYKKYLTMAKNVSFHIIMNAKEKNGSKKLEPLEELNIWS